MIKDLTTEELAHICGLIKNLKTIFIRLSIAEPHEISTFSSKIDNLLNHFETIRAPSHNSHSEQETYLNILKNLKIQENQLMISRNNSSQNRTNSGSNCSFCGHTLSIFEVYTSPDNSKILMIKRETLSYCKNCLKEVLTSFDHLEGMYYCNID